MKVLWRLGEEKESGRPSPVLMRRPVWGGQQAAGKRHSQLFSQKRLPHPRVVCQPTKPVTGRSTPTPYIRTDKMRGKKTLDWALGFTNRGAMFLIKLASRPRALFSLSNRWAARRRRTIAAGLTKNGLPLATKKMCPRALPGGAVGHELVVYGLWHVTAHV